MNKISLKRVYEPFKPEDGFRILVDRLWPRGLSKEAAKIDLWVRDIAPSNELRKEYNHEPEKWNSFRDSYFKELKSKAALINSLLEIIGERSVTFLYSTRNTENNNAVALKEYLEGQAFLEGYNQDAK